MRYNDAPSLIVSEYQGCRPTTPFTPSQGLMKLNETKWMGWVWRNGGMKFIAGENRKNPGKNLLRPRFLYNETHVEWLRRELKDPALGCERLAAFAKRPPCTYFNMSIILYKFLTALLAAIVSYISIAGWHYCIFNCLIFIFVSYISVTSITVLILRCNFR